MVLFVSRIKPKQDLLSIYMNIKKKSNKNKTCNLFGKLLATIDFQLIRIFNKYE